MKNYFEFVKELSLKNNKTFKEQLMNPETKKLWNQVRPVKTRVSRVKAKNIANQQGISQEAPGVKVDLSRAKIVPATVQQEPDRMLDYYNQRWSNFVNTINPENYRNVYAIDKRPKELKPFNLDSIRYLLMDKRAIIEDSPLSYELSSYVFNPRVNFPGKRNLKILRNDKTKLSTYLKDINMLGNTSEFNHDFEYLQTNNIKSYSLYEQIEKFEQISGNRIQQANVVYLNDMMYTKRQMYSRIFLYGGFLTKRTNRDKYLIVTSNSDLGRNVATFYKNLDVGYFNSKEFDFGISATPEFNFSQIANYMAGTSSEIPLASTVKKQPSSAAPVSSAVSSSAVSALSYAVVPGAPPHLSESFPHENPTIFPNQDKEFSQRIYFERGAIITLKDTQIIPNDFYNVGDFIYYNKGYLSQVVAKNKGRQLTISIFYTDKNGVNKVQYLTLKAGNKSIPRFQPIRFIKPDKITPTSEYTCLRNMAIDEDLTYEQVYNSYRKYFTDQVDTSNERGVEGGLLQSDKGPNDFIKFEYIPSPSKVPQTQVQTQTQPEVNPPPVNQDEEEIVTLDGSGLLGGALTEEDLAAWLSMFSLKGVDVIADVGNNQKAYLLSF